MNPVGTPAAQITFVLPLSSISTLPAASAPTKNLAYAWVLGASKTDWISMLALGTVCLTYFAS